MTEVSFYHLTRQSATDALPRLLERALAGGMRALVLAASADRVATLDKALWSYDPASFLPHGSGKTHADHQPIYLTDHEENPNGATLLFVTDGAEPAFLGSFDRCLDLFEDSDKNAVEAARARWVRYKAAGHNLTYWQQKPDGGWEKKA